MADRRILGNQPVNRRYGHRLARGSRRTVRGARARRTCPGAHPHREAHRAAHRATPGRAANFDRRAPANRIARSPPKSVGIDLACMGDEFGRLVHAARHIPPEMHSFVGLRFIDLHIERREARGVVQLFENLARPKCRRQAGDPVEPVHVTPGHSGPDLRFQTDAPRVFQRLNCPVERSGHAAEAVVRFGIRTVEADGHAGHAAFAKFPNLVSRQKRCGAGTDIHAQSQIHAAPEEG